MAQVFKVRDNGEQDSVTEFWLEKEGGEVTLKARNNNIPFNWKVLSITGDGAISRHTSVETRLGLELDCSGRVRVSE